ncbi:MAG: 2-C-methyl-D-erythritol 4-phosphate cytidylyltransferase [Victivallaceae bacterium]|nr:2-C-methyl-D-erythritol 4-phosphate cytidylyltransferase [Victivallaceae bacterium]
MTMTVIEDLGIIIAAAGTGSRFGAGDKLLRKLDGLPLFLHSVRTFYPLCPAGNLIVVAHPGQVAAFGELAGTYLPGCRVRFVAGAELRAGSVRCGLAALAAGTKFVAVHDAARPLATAGLLQKCLAAARLHGGAVPAKPVTDTLKRTSPAGRIIDTVRRDNLWQVETPQVFDLEQLLDAHRQAAALDVEFTDDAAVMEIAGYEVYIVHNRERNVKITYREDLGEVNKNDGQESYA